MTKYTIIHMSDDSCVWHIDAPDIEADDIADALKKALDWMESSIERSMYDGGGENHDAISVELTVRLVEADLWSAYQDDESSDTDEPESARGNCTVEFEANHASLIRAAVGRDHAAIDCEHEWTRDYEGGCDENPGVWSLGGTTILTRETCAKCGLTHAHTSLGSQRNPGETDSDEYDVLSADDLAALRERAGLED